MINVTVLFCVSIMDDCQNSIFLTAIKTPYTIYTAFIKVILNLLRFDHHDNNIMIKRQVLFLTYFMKMGVSYFYF